MEGWTWTGEHWQEEDWKGTSQGKIKNRKEIGYGEKEKGQVDITKQRIRKEERIEGE